MRYLALLPALALALVACSETPIPSEPESHPDQPAASFSAAASSNGYTAIDLGTLGGNWSQANDINDAGAIVGASQTSSGQAHAFIWDGMNMKDLGTLGGSYSVATAINDHGQVVGLSTTASGEYRSFLWNGVSMYELGSLGASLTTPNDISDDGKVVGWGWIPPDNMPHALLWDGTNPTDLGTGGRTWSRAEGINSHGTVVGARFPNDASLWDGTTWQVLFADDVWTSGAFAINNAGMVVGHLTTVTDESYAFMWDGTTTHHLEKLDGGRASVARDINDGGQIVGWSQTVWNGQEHAVMWDASGIHDLHPSGADRSSAYGINSVGQIAGTVVSSYVGRATLWRILTPLEKLATCATMASDLEAQGVLNQGQAHSFVNKINLATAALNDGKNTPAINKLEAFQNEASAYLNGGNLTQEQGDELISCVQGVIDSL